MIDDIQARMATIEARFGRSPVASEPTVTRGEAASLHLATAFQRALAESWQSAATPGTLGDMLFDATPPVLRHGAPAVPTGKVPAQAAQYAAAFDAAGARYGVDPRLLAAVAWTESNFDADAVSHAGALGLMQIMPGTAAGLGVDPRDPIQAIDGAARYLREQLDRFGDVRLALAAYNAGPGAVQRHGGIPPYPETISYVDKVLGRHAQLGSSA